MEYCLDYILSDYLHNFYIVLILQSQRNTSQMVVQVICKYYAILHKELEHPQILMFGGIFLDSNIFAYCGKFLNMWETGCHQPLSPSVQMLAASEWPCLWVFLLSPCSPPCLVFDLLALTALEACESRNCTRLLTNMPSAPC